MSSDKLILWDDAAIGETSCVWRLDDGRSVRVDAVGDGVFRVRFSLDGRWTESALNRYGFINADFPAFAFASEERGDALAVHAGAATLVMDRGGMFRLADGAGEVVASSCAPQTGQGFRLAVRLAPGERIYGMGDSSRENVMRRGAKYNMWVVDVYGYMPVPLALSDHGWGLFVNTTWRSAADIGCANPDEAVFEAAISPLDFYVFAGRGLPTLLDKYTRITGRPKLLPVWAYALTYVAHEQINAFELMNEASEFRRQGIPCDAMGLEPGWMSVHYDKSLEKKWSDERFPMPWWAMTGPQTFPSALKRIGFKLSLWLCCDYDLMAYEEKRLRGETETVRTAGDAPVGRADAFEQDTNINPELAELRDKAQKKDDNGDEPWFEHLKKFVDQGADAFKLDGAWQVVEHPDRIYANGMDDEQAHNLYPLVLDRQMARGFEEHAGRRAMIYSASGYAGLQKYVATWAGDTGGGQKPLVSMLNLGLCGHSNHSCDMDVFTDAGIHFGFLQTWAQLCNWCYWRQPWYLEPERLDMFRDYARLRYRLLPYLYSTAWQASVSGLPAMRAMALAFPDMEDGDSIMSQYMLGDSLLVTAFADTLSLPKGEWLDFWTGRRLAGPWRGPAEFPANRGGCLLLREGAIVPTWPVRSHVTSGYSEEIGFILNPGEAETAFVLYEDEGHSLDYQKGACTTTRLILRQGRFSVKPREGAFEGMPGRRNVSLEIHLKAKPARVAVDGRDIDFSWDGRAASCTFEMASATGADISFA